MKKGKLLILLAAVLSLTMLATACQEGEKSPADTSASTSGTTEVETSAVTGAPETEKSTTSAETQEPETEPETEPVKIKHEMHDWFILADKKEPTNFSNVSRLEGEVIKADYSHNLIVIQDQDLDRYNNVITKLTVHNVLTGETLVKAEASSPLNTPVVEDRVFLDVQIDYPVIRVIKSYYENDKEVYDADYYLAKAGEDNCIYSVDAVNKDLVPVPDGFYVDHLRNGLIKATMGDKVMWIDKDMNVVRAVEAIAENGYYDEFNGEYQGFLYVLMDKYVRVYNRQGLRSAEYSCEMNEDAKLVSCILDNGNVLVQECVKVDEYTTCDFTNAGERYVVNTYVLDFDNGSMTEVDLDFMVQTVSTAYAQQRRDSLPSLALAEGKDNMAYIYRFANGNINAYPELVVMSNDLEVQYSVKNSTLGVNLYSIDVIDEYHYRAYVDSGVASGYYVFDLDGNVVSYNASGYMAEGYKIVGGGYIYDTDGKLVYDALAAGFTNVDGHEDVIYLGKFNFATGGYEEFILDTKKMTPVMLTDGVEKDLVSTGNSYYTVKDIETGVYTVYTLDGTELLATLYAPYVSVNNDIYVITTEFDGKDLVYIVKEDADPVIKPETEPETETTEDTASDAN